MKRRTLNNSCINSGLIGRILVMIVAMVMLMTQPVISQRIGRSFESERILERVEKASAQLQLSQEQQTQVRGLVESFITDHQSEIEQLQKLRSTLKEARASGDREKMEQVTTEMKVTGASLREAGQELRTAIAGLLSDEQKEMASALFFQRPGRAKGEKRKAERGLDRCNLDRKAIAEQVGLTESQMEEMRSAREAFRSEHEGDRQRLKGIREELRAARKEGNQEKIQELRTQLKEEMEVFRSARKELREHLKGILTEEQREALNHLRDDCRSERKVGTQQGRAENSAKPAERDRVRLD